MGFLDKRRTEHAGVKPPQTHGRPLCVDLDGTVVKTDTLMETFVSALLRDPSVILRLPWWLLRGRAALKQNLARHGVIDAAALPYNDALLAFLEEQKSAGRRLILVTAADAQVATAVADHIGLFDEVIASDGTRNLKGKSKARVLTERFGENGFDYIGDAAVDLKVWDHAHDVMICNATSPLIRAAVNRYGDVQIIAIRGPRIKPLIKALRPHQWIKNSLVFVPLLAVGALTDTVALASTALAFLAFCLTASAVYLSNDLMDLATDRAHARKRLRPFASGDLPLSFGVVLAPVLFAAGLLVAFCAGIVWLVAAYALASTLYSIKLKELPLVDVFVLAGLYTGRIVAGGAASGHLVSLWLLAFSCFIFLSLAFIKRVAELYAMNGESTRLGRRGYYRSDFAMLSVMGVAASFIAAIILALYVQDISRTEAYRQPLFLWTTVPLLLFWQCRLWLSTTRGYMNDDPIVYAARDRVSWVVGVFLAGAVGCARLPPFTDTALFLVNR
jgi:4-hydroxybenzoate polyprenyltransferase